MFLFRLFISCFSAVDLNNCFLEDFNGVNLSVTSAGLKKMALGPRQASVRPGTGEGSAAVSEGRTDRFPLLVLSVKSWVRSATDVPSVVKVEVVKPAKV